MDIKNIYAGISQYQTAQIDKKKVSGTPNTQGKDKGESSTDTITLSNRGKLLQTSTEAAKESSGTRAEKIQELKKQIDSGEYTPQPRKIAQGIIQEEIDLWS
jgi:negative regulator of flagellin synthesis FlgM